MMRPALEPSLVVLGGALILDAVWGEPPSSIHPVVWMGKLASAMEHLAPRRGAVGPLIAGALIAIAVPSAFAGVSLLVARLAPWPILWVVVSAVLFKATFAVRGLGRAAFAVRDALATGALPEARLALRSLCARDPGDLDSPLLVTATVESVAENASDSFVAPLLYYSLFGLPGAMFYRAVNTLDAMIGYRGRYEFLGKASARLDDLLNLVPARVTAALLLAAGWLGRYRVRAGWIVLRRDGGTTESPNAGRPMAAMAGLLGVQLEKVGRYRLGDPIEALEIGKIDQAWRLVAVSAALASALAIAALGVRLGL